MAGMRQDLAQHVNEYQKCDDERKNATIIMIEDKKSAEVSLVAYSSYAVSDNFMYDDDDDNNSDWRMRRDPSLREGGIKLWLRRTPNWIDSWTSWNKNSWGADSTDQSWVGQVHFL